MALLLRALLLTACAALLPAQAWAETSAGLVRKGVQLRSAGNDEAALEQFKRAYNMDQNPVALAQMAQAEQALGLWVDAQKHLRQALALHHEWIEKNRQPLEGALAVVDKHVGLLDVRCEVLGAKLYVNDRHVGDTPLEAPIPLVAGTIVLAVRSEGYHPVTRQLQVSGGLVTREMVQLVPAPTVEPEPSSSASLTTPTTVVVNTSSDARRADGAPPEPATGYKVQRAVGIGTGVLGVLGIGGTVGAWLARESAVDELSETKLNEGCFDDMRETSWTQACTDGEDEVDQRQKLAVGLGVGAGVLTLTSIVLLWTLPDRPRGRATACGTGPGQLGLACRMQF